MSWFDNVIPMQPSHGLISSDFDAMEDQYFFQLEDEILREDWLQSLIQMSQMLSTSLNISHTLMLQTSSWELR